MRILFIGSTRRGYMTVKSLVEMGNHVVGIISLQQHEHEIERYEETIESFAKEHNIPHFETKWMKDQDYVELISNQLRPDIAFVVGCRIIIPPEIYQIPRLGTLAVHDSLLPEYRGFAPLNWSIINGEDHTGVTLFYLSDLMDGGEIVAQKCVPIDPKDTAQLVYERICQATVDLILETYPLFVQGTAQRIKQDYSKGSFTCSRTPLDGEINWARPTNEIYNQIRALTIPYPGAFTYLDGSKMMVWMAEPLDKALVYKGRIPGRVVNISKSEGYVDVLTGDGILRIFNVQLEGLEMTMAANVIKSVRASLGLRIVDLLERIRDLERKLYSS